MEKNVQEAAQNRLLSPETMRGIFLTEELRPGLGLHATDLEVLHPILNEGRVEPGLRLILMLKGKLEARFGGNLLEMHGGQADQCVLLAIAEEERMQRRISQAGQQSQVVLTISEQWLEEGGLCHLPGYGKIHHFFNQHLAQSPVQSSPQLKASALALLHPPEAPSFLQKLHRECRALELISSALGQLGHTGTSLSEKDKRKVAQLTELLQQAEGELPSLSDLAKTLGSNPTTLQKLFKAVHGTSIIDFSRKERLSQARDLLNRGASVSEAALAIGYQNPGNFSTAFKRQFGFSPKNSKTAH